MNENKAKLKDIPTGTAFWVFYEHFKVRGITTKYTKLDGNYAKTCEDTVVQITHLGDYNTRDVFVEN